MGSMDGRICLVTGALGAIGTPLCAGLAREGATVVLGVRDEARGEAAVDDLRRSSGNGNISYAVGDMASLASVHGMAEAMRVRHPQFGVGSVISVEAKELRRAEPGPSRPGRRPAGRGVELGRPAGRRVVDPLESRG